MLDRAVRMAQSAVEGIFQTVGLILAFAIIALVALLRERLQGDLQRAFDRLFGGDHVFTARDVELDRSIYSVLVEIRVRAGFDRVHLTQFHNGNFFSARNPVWKLSRTHEVCRPGVSYHARDMQNIPISVMIDLLAPLWEEELPAGASRLLCDCRPGCDRLIIWYDVPTSPDSISKGMLGEQGVVTMMVVPVLDGENVVGFICGDNCDLDDPETGQQYRGRMMCSAAARIGYLLEKRRGGAKRK